MKTKILALATTLFAALTAGAAVETLMFDDFSTTRSEWKLPSTGGFLSTGALRIAATPAERKNNNLAKRTVDVTRWKGRLLFFSVEACAWKVTRPHNNWNGIKFMIHYNSPEYGRVWMHPVNLHGSFGWKQLYFACTLPDDIREATLCLGLEDSSGAVEFRNIRLESPVNRPFPGRAEYSDAVRNMPPLRGMMSPQQLTAGDLSDLRLWGANLLRWQFCRNWGVPFTDRDLAEYGTWIQGKLAEFDRVLADAERNGLKVILDLHSPPGGRRDGADFKDMEMFYNRKYADWFVNFWREVARRYKNHPAIWGYDLINEPVQSRPSKHGYWELQMEAAEAIRKIDPERPIIVEANNWAAPESFRYLKPFPLKNIIYQLHCYLPLAYTHQLVHKGTVENPVFLTYPGRIDGVMWNREKLRRMLEPVRQFQQRYGARIYVGEFSAIRWAPGAARYLADAISIFEEYGWDWSYHAFREWDGWSLEYTDRYDEKKKAATPTDRMKVIREYFRRNAVSTEHVTEADLSFLPAPTLKENKPAAREYRILFKGNSITRHGTNPQIKATLGWDRRCGMAASSEARDYAHLLAERIQRTMSDRPVRIEFSTPDVAEGETEKNFHPDLVILQTGEHSLPGDKSVEEFERLYRAVVASLKKFPAGTQLIAVEIWAPTNGKPYEGKSLILRNLQRKICAENGIPTVSVERYASDPSCRGAGEHHGVRWHPNDKGMAGYANAIFAVWQREQARKSNKGTK